MLRVLQLFCCCCSFFFENFHWNEFRKVWWEDRLEIKLGLREGEEQAEPQGVTSLGGDEPKGLPTPLCGGKVKLTWPCPPLSGGTNPLCGARASENSLHPVSAACSPTLNSHQGAPHHVSKLPSRPV